MFEIIRTETTDTFISKYESTCQRCTQKINKGDQVRYLEGSLRHYDCKKPEGTQLLYMQEPRKKVSKSFTSRSSGTCASCYLPYREGDTIRYNTDDELVHARHTKKIETYEVCNLCFLVKPCECD